MGFAENAHTRTERSANGTRHEKGVVLMGFYPVDTPPCRAVIDTIGFIPVTW